MLCKFCVSSTAPVIENTKEQQYSNVIIYNNFIVCNQAPCMTNTARLTQSYLETFLKGGSPVCYYTYVLPFSLSVYLFVFSSQTNHCLRYAHPAFNLNATRKYKVQTKSENYMTKI